MAKDETNPTSYEEHRYVLNKELVFPKLIVDIKCYPKVEEVAIKIRRTAGLDSCWPPVMLIGVSRGKYSVYDLDAEEEVWRDVSHRTSQVSAITKDVSAEYLRDFSGKLSWEERIRTRFWSEEGELNALEKLLQIGSVPEEGKKLIHSPFKSLINF